MSQYEALAAMGVKHPEHIVRFTLSTTTNTDILRIVYERKKGAILPTSVNYRFPRIKKSALVDSGTRRTEVIYESSLEFRSAVAELEKLMESRKTTENLEELINQEVRALEEEVALRIDGIKTLVKRISSAKNK